jgi:hypothetical protein
VNTRTLRRTGQQVASSLEDVSDKITEVVEALRGEAEKAGGEVRGELAALPDQLEGVGRSVLSAVEPYRPPKRYRPYAQLTVLVVVVVAAVVTAVVVRSRQAARTAGTPLIARTASHYVDGRQPPTTKPPGTSERPITR